jgi:hypothetical protein
MRFLPWLTLLVLVSGCLRSRVVELELVNTGSTPLRNVEVLYPGGSYGLAQLLPQQPSRNRIKPLSAGAVQLRYMDAQGVTHTRSGPRVVKDEESSIRISVDDSGLKWVTNAHP